MKWALFSFDEIGTCCSDFDEMRACCSVFLSLSIEDIDDLHYFTLYRKFVINVAETILLSVKTISLLFIRNQLLTTAV